MRTPATLIAEEAAQWVSRLDREGDNAALRAEMITWESADPRRRGALLRAEAAWVMLDRAAVLGVPVTDEAPAACKVAQEEGKPRKRRFLWASGVAAVAAAVALMVTPLVSPPVQEIETALGEIRHVPLADGSRAAVNSDSKVEVALKSEERHVMLERGEAWFEVAKDPERPFVVEAGDVRVKAVGTAFSVHKLGDVVDVRVTEGVVEVWRVGDEGQRQRIAAGAQVSVGDEGGAVAMAAAEPMERALSWRDGQLIFEGDTLSAAAAKFNRYNDVKIEISDEKLGQEKMIGRFRTNEPHAFARAAAALLQANVDVKEDRIYISSN